MAEIQSLKQIYNKEGLDFIEKLFNNYIIISEKLNATRFSFTKSDSGDFVFYKKDGPITAIERTLIQIFEEPIAYIQNLPKEVKTKIPVDYRFGFRYFHSSTPINIKYDKLPKNGLILTDLKRLSDDKVIDDPQILNTLANLLSVQSPPIIWSGKLNDEQKANLIQYIKTSEKNLEDTYKIESFTKYIISILDSNINKTSLNDDIEKSIDSIIFKFIGEEGKEIMHAKIVDPIILQLNKTNEDREPQDMYGIVLSDIVEFIKINGLKKYKISNGSIDIKFIELACEIYNDYINKNEYKFKGVVLNSLSFNLVPKLDLNTGFISNIRTRENIHRSTINKNIFKILVSSLHKPNRKPIGTLTSALIEDLKEISKNINKIINSEKRKDGDILTFEDYLYNKNQSIYSIKD